MANNDAGIFWECYGDYTGKRNVKYFMRYVKAKYEKYQQALAYRIYISDSLFAQGDGKRLTSRYMEIIKPAPTDKRTGDEIAQDVIHRLGLVVE